MSEERQAARVARLPADYPEGYRIHMDTLTAGRLVREARSRAGVSARELAERAATSRTAISAYENDRKIPTADTLLRLLRAAGTDVALADTAPTFRRHDIGRGRYVWVPDRLPRLDTAEALRTVKIPRRIFWSSHRDSFDLSVPDDRAEVYAAVLSEGEPADILRLVDGLLLSEMWDRMWLPPAVRKAWQPLVDAARTIPA